MFQGVFLKIPLTDSQTVPGTTGKLSALVGHRGDGAVGSNFYGESARIFACGKPFRGIGGNVVSDERSEIQFITAGFGEFAYQVMEFLSRLFIEGVHFLILNAHTGPGKDVMELVYNSCLPDFPD